MQIFERIERLAQPIFNSSSFRGFLEWARNRELNIRAKAGRQRGKDGPSLGDAWYQGDKPLGKGDAYLEGQARKLDVTSIITELRGLLTANPDSIEMVMMSDNRSLSSMSTQVTNGTGSAGEHRSNTSGPTQVRYQSAGLHSTCPFTHGLFAMGLRHRRFGSTMR